MSMGEPFSGPFELDKDTDNTVRFVEGPVFDANQLPTIGHSISYHRPSPSRQCRRMSDNHRCHHIRHKPIRVRIR